MQPKPRRYNDDTSVNFRNFDENEDTTIIDEVVLVKVSLLKCILMVPFLSIITGLVYLLVLYWKPYVRFISFYQRTTMRDATYVCVFGKGNLSSLFNIHRWQH
jgi:hypothetical protein